MSPKLKPIMPPPLLVQPKRNELSPLRKWRRRPPRWRNLKLARLTVAKNVASTAGKDQDREETHAFIRGAAAIRGAD
jgi:hypothetical protein